MEDLRYNKPKKQPEPQVYFYSWAMKNGWMEKPKRLDDKRKEDLDFRVKMDNYDHTCETVNIVLVIIAIMVILSCVVE